MGGGFLGKIGGLKEWLDVEDVEGYGWVRSDGGFSSRQRIGVTGGWRRSKGGVGGTRTPRSESWRG